MNLHACYATTQKLNLNSISPNMGNEAPKPNMGKPNVD